MYSQLKLQTNDKHNPAHMPKVVLAYILQVLAMQCYIGPSNTHQVTRTHGYRLLGLR